MSVEWQSRQGAILAVQHERRVGEAACRQQGPRWVGFGALSRCCCWNGNGGSARAPPPG